MEAATGPAVNAIVSSAMSPALRITAYAASEWPCIAPLWGSLAESCARGCMFFTPAWVETWLEIFGPALDVSILLFENAGQQVAVSLLVKTTRRRALLPIRRASLNAAGEDPAETTYLESNRLLCRPGWETPVAYTLARFVQKDEWDEFVLDGFCPGPGYEALQGAFRCLALEEVRRLSCYVDLAGLRRAGRAYQEILSGHRRKLLRQSVRAYSRLGVLRIETAPDADRALSMFDELARMNIERLARRGRRSVFCSERFVRFHRTLIRRCLGQRSIQLFRLSAGPHTVGLLYVFTLAGRVSFYQCGFNYALDEHASPGVVTLAFAVQDCLEKGFDCWDFLSGDGEYKQALSNGSHELVWAVFRKKTPRVWLFEKGRSVRRLMGKILSGRGVGSTIARRFRGVESRWD